MKDSDPKPPDQTPEKQPSKDFEPETGATSGGEKEASAKREEPSSSDDEVLADKKPSEVDFKHLQKPLPPEDPSRPRSWTDDIFTTGAWHRHLVFAIAAMCLAMAALWFYYMAGMSEIFLDYLYREAPWALFLVLPLGFMFIIYLRNNEFPGTQGTGIPQTIAALRMRPDLRGTVLSVRIAIGKIILTSLGLFSGASIGREGPSVHVGACFMHICQRFARFPQNLTDRGLILGGGAAGIAASFNAPFAGIVFACEEIGRSFEKENMGTIIRTVGICCIAVIAAIDNNYLFYGSVKTSLYEPWQWLVAVPLIGIIGGFLGGLFSQCLRKLLPVVTKFAKNHGMLVAVSIGMSLALFAMISEGESLGSGFLDAKRIIHGEGEELSVLYPFYRAAVTFITLLSGIPGGLFDPTLSAGAGLGNNLAPFFQQFGHIDTKAVVMMAMVAYFTGVVQSPITSMVIMVEMTAAVAMSLPLLAVAIIAYEVSHKVCPQSLYETIADEFLAARRQKHLEEQKAKGKEVIDD